MAPSSGYAAECRAAFSIAITSSPTPPSRLVVPVKYRSTNAWSRPIASNACAPAYEPTTEMPIFDMIFSTPLPSALIRFLTAFSGVMPVTRPLRTSCSAVSIARYGLIADAPYPISSAT